MPIVDLASTPKTAEKSRKSKSIELNDKKVIQKNTESAKKAVQKTMEPPKKVIQKGTEPTKKAVHTNKRKNPAPKKKPPLKIPAKSKSKENVSTSKSFSLSSPKSKKVEGSMKRTLRRPSRLSKLNAELKTELLADEESEEITDQSDEEGQNDVYVEEFLSSEEEIAEHNSDDEEYDPANETVDGIVIFFTLNEEQYSEVPNKQPPPHPPLLFRNPRLLIFQNFLTKERRIREMTSRESAECYFLSGHIFEYIYIYDLCSNYYLKSFESL